MLWLLRLALRVLKNHMKGSAVDYYFNDATRAYTVGQLTALHKAEGQWVTVSSVFGVLRSSHMEVNGGQTELTLAMFDGLLSEEPARVMMARPCRSQWAWSSSLSDQGRAEKNYHRTG